MINAKNRLLYMVLILMSATNLGANDTYKKSSEFNALHKTKTLNLEIDHADIEEYQCTINQKDSPLLPGIFKDEGKDGNVSIDGGVLITNEVIDSGSFDGAEISIKVKTN